MNFAINIKKPTGAREGAGFKINKNIIQKLIIVGVLAMIVIALSLLSDRFLTYNNFMNVARQVAMVIITGSAVTMLMISGNIDLSVGSIVAISGVVMAQFTTYGIPLPLAVVMASIVGGCAGCLNGALVTKLRIPSVIASLGTMYVVRGLAYVLCAGKTINLGLPRNFGILGRGSIASIPIPLLVTIVVAGAFIFIQTSTILGKYTFAIGGNRTTAILSGINVNAIVFFLFVITGVLAGFSGSILASRMGVGTPLVGEGFEFDVIVAVLLGGTSLAGGQGSIIGMLIGALIVGFLGNGLNLLNVYTFYQSIVKGFVLVIAVVLDITLKEKLK